MGTDNRARNLPPCCGNVGFSVNGVVEVWTVQGQHWCQRYCLDETGSTSTAIRMRHRLYKSHIFRCRFNSACPLPVLTAPTSTTGSSRVPSIYDMHWLSRGTFPPWSWQRI